MISNKTDYLDRILKLWEFLYSKEGLLVTEFGFEGDTYTLDSEGRVKWTQKYLDLLADPNISATAVIGNESLWLLRNSVTYQQVEPPPANRAEKIGRDIWAYFGPYVYDDTAFQNLGPFGGTDEAVLDSEITVYMDEQIPKMVLAASDEELMAVYDETMKTLKKMGIDAVRKAQNERFQENKDRIGVKFAWPDLQ